MELKNRKSETTFLYLLILILIIINFVTIISILNNRKINREFNSIIAKKQIENDNTREILYKNLEFQLILHRSLNRDICDSVLMNSSKILLLFNGNGCKQCILSLIMDLNILAEKIGKENIILVGDFDNKKTFEDYLLNINDGFKSILFKNVFDIQTIKIDKPTLLIIEPDYSTYIFYNPEGEPTVRKKYFEELIPALFINRNLRQNKSKR